MKKCDVFISFKRNALDGSGKTKDCILAEKLHRTLLDNGIETFFSEKDLSTSAFTEQIYDALDDAKILIVVGTQAEHVTSKWVKSEWNTFLNAINGGRKQNGEIITYLDGMTRNQLPLALYGRESFSPANADVLVQWVKKNLGLEDSGKSETTAPQNPVNSQPTVQTAPNNTYSQRPVYPQPRPQSPSGQQSATQQYVQSVPNNTYLQTPVYQQQQIYHQPPAQSSYSQQTTTRYAQSTTNNTNTKTKSGWFQKLKYDFQYGNPEKVATVLGLISVALFTIPVIPIILASVGLKKDKGSIWSWAGLIGSILLTSYYLIVIVIGIF